MLFISRQKWLTGFVANIDIDNVDLRCLSIAPSGRSVELKGLKGFHSLHNIGARLQPLVSPTSASGKYDRMVRVISALRIVARWRNDVLEV